MILRQIWQPLFCIFYANFISLTLFPAVLANVQSTTALAGKFFSVLWCFLSFNLCAMAGNITVDLLPRRTAFARRWLWLMALARTLFLPFFLFCNFKPTTRAVGVAFSNDAFFIIGVAVFAFSHGYVSSLGMITAPASVHPHHASVAGMMASFTIMVGIASGIGASFLAANIV